MRGKGNSGDETMRGEGGVEEVYDKEVRSVRGQKTCEGSV